MANIHLLYQITRKTIKLLESGCLDDFTHNKTIQKIVESTRINKIEKEMIKNMKRCNNEK